MCSLGNIFSYAIVIALYSAVTQCEPLYESKPWPLYSLQNMPNTQFTCHDKIIGGYYADSETQCQMFHVCVAVANAGVQDFRFLCPNGTAFDQELQICAYWADVDCVSSVLYYGSDNFDLYRIGSSQENKRAPLAEEEESTFHLQRAESGDIKRSKETRVDQQFRPDEPPNYSRPFPATARNSKKRIEHVEANSHTKSKLNHQSQNNRNEGTTKTPIVNYYTPTTTRTTTTTTTEKYYNHDESKQEIDEIFKGSHSSNFFSNRNGGREDDFNDHPARGKPNDFTDYSKKAESSTIGKNRVHPTRGKRPVTSTTYSTTGQPSTSTTIRKSNQQSSYNGNFFGYSPSTSTPSTTTTLSSFTSIPSTVRTQSNNRFKLKTYDYQENIQPTTYNPGNNKYKFKTTTAKYADIGKNKYDNYEKSKLYSKPTAASNNRNVGEPSKVDFENIKPNSRPKDENNLRKLKTQQPHPFQPSQIFRAPPVSPKDGVESSIQLKPAAVDTPPTRLRGQALSPVRGNNNKAEANSLASSQRTRGTTTTTTEKAKTSSIAMPSPRGFTSRGSINYKTSTQKAAELTAQTLLQTYKKFSTLVPKNQYTTPPTFKPTTKNFNEYNFYQTPQTTQSPRKTQKPVPISSTQIPTTANPYYNPDEDDGQYHPELYEVDYTSKNHYNLLRSSTTVSTTSTTTPKPFTNSYNNPQNHLKTQQLTAFQKQQQLQQLQQQQQQQQQQASEDSSEEDELFKGAQSLNFGAASINKLRQDIIKAEKTSQQYNSQYIPHIPNTDAFIATTASGFSLPNNSTSQPLTTRKPSQSTTTTIRPFSTSTTTAARNYDNGKINKASSKPTKSTGLGKKSGKKLNSKRPPHADEDTSYDYAYYDTDTLSESPQDYPEYRIEEFSKTPKL